jgi:fructokinase
MQQSTLFRIIRRNLHELLGGYLNCKELTETIEEYVVPPKLGRNSGAFGAIALASRALEAHIL